MKPDREQWNIATLCNLGIYSVLYDNCVWLKMSVITDVVCYRLCFMILKNGILLRVQGWDVLRGREWDLQMTPRSRVLSVKFRFISYCRVFFFYAVSGDTFFFYLINSQIGCISRKSHKFICSFWCLLVYSSVVS